MRVSLWLGSLVVVCLTAAQVTVVSAAEEEKEEGAFNAEAKKKFAEGNEHYAKGEYDAAIEAFKQAIAIDPKLPGPYRNLGLAYRALNRCSDALPMYEKYLEIKPESRFTERVRREIDICRAKLGMEPLPEHHVPSAGYHAPGAQSYLHVAANLIGGEATDEASVKVDGIMRGSTPITMAITAGKHRVHLERPGFEKADAVVDVQPGQRAEVELTMNKLAEEVKPAVVTTEENPAEQKPKGSYRKYGWAMLAVAAGLGLMGGAFGIAESQLHYDAITADHTTTTRDQINQQTSTGQNYAVGSYIGLSVGAAALVASCIIFLVDPSRGESHEKPKYTPTAKRPTRFVLAPSVEKGGAGFAAAVTF